MEKIFYCVYSAVNINELRMTGNLLYYSPAGVIDGIESHLNKQGLYNVNIIHSEEVTEVQAQHIANEISKSIYSYTNAINN